MSNDPQTGNEDIWTVDVASGKGTPITNDTPPENAPIWSPDGKQVAYVSTKDGYAGIYRKACRWNRGTRSCCSATHQEPGWFSPTGHRWKVPDLLHWRVGRRADRRDEKALDRKEIDWLREDYDVGPGPFLSRQPFPRLPVERSRRRPTMQVYVRPFDAAQARCSRARSRCAGVARRAPSG